MVTQSPTRVEELVKIFIHATKVSSQSDRCFETPVLTAAVDGDGLLGDGFDVVAERCVTQNLMPRPY